MLLQPPLSALHAADVSRERRASVVAKRVEDDPRAGEEIFPGGLSARFTPTMEFARTTGDLESSGRQRGGWIPHSLCAASGRSP